jgi:hypothetical protein
MTYTHLMATTRPLEAVRQPSLDTTRLHRPAPACALPARHIIERPEPCARFTWLDVLKFLAVVITIVAVCLATDAVLAGGGQP